MPNRCTVRRQQFPKTRAGCAVLTHGLRLNLRNCYTFRGPPSTGSIRTSVLESEDYTVHYLLTRGRYGGANRNRSGSGQGTGYPRPAGGGALGNPWRGEESAHGSA